MLIGIRCRIKPFRRRLSILCSIKKPKSLQSRSIDVDYEKTRIVGRRSEYAEKECDMAENDASKKPNAVRRFFSLLGPGFTLVMFCAAAAMFVL